MQAHDIMISHVYKVKEKDNVRSVVEKFTEYRISGLPVVNDRNEIIAYISDGDIMRYIANTRISSSMPSILGMCSKVTMRNSRRG